MRDFPLFNDVDNPTLRTWNRLNILYNIKENLGNTMSHKYMNHFNKKAKVQIMSMHERVLANGFANVRREIVRGLQ